MSRPLDEILKELSLSTETGNALAKRKSEVGKLLSLFLNYERGNWLEFTGCRIPADDLSSAYLESIS